jgi:hypothetical protein
MILTPGFMGQLITELRTYLYEYLVTELRYMATIRVMDEAVGEHLIGPQHLPALLIQPHRSYKVRGPFANTSTWTGELSLLGIVRSVDPSAFQMNPTSGATPSIVNMHVIADLIREKLYQCKHLTDQTFELKSKYEIQYGIYEPKVGAQYPMFSIFLEYTRLETDTGMQNDQASLNTPPPQLPPTGPTQL